MVTFSDGCVVSSTLILGEFSWDALLTVTPYWLVPCKRMSLEHGVYVSQLTEHVTHFERYEACEVVL